MSRAPKIVAAFNPYKESISSEEAGEAFLAGFARVFPDAEVVTLAAADGGDGFLPAFAKAVQGRKQTFQVTGPRGEQVTAEWALSSDGTRAVIESALACGLKLVPEDKRNPGGTTTRGVGELLRHVLETTRAEEIFIGVGGSATNDGFAGGAEALGARFKPAGHPWTRGADLLFLEELNTAGLHPRLREVKITVVCDVDNPLCGPNGAAWVFGRQKGPGSWQVPGGAGDRQLELLDQALMQLARVSGREDLAAMRGAGAAGGMGFGLSVFCDAKLVPGAEAVLEASSFSSFVEGADLVVTGEGGMGASTAANKLPYVVARLAREKGVPCVSIVGRTEPGFEACLGPKGFAACYAITDYVSKEEALREPAKHLSRIAQALGEQCLAWNAGGNKYHLSPLARLSLG